MKICSYLFHRSTAKVRDYFAKQYPHSSADRITLLAKVQCHVERVYEAQLMSQMRWERFSPQEKHVYRILFESPEQLTLALNGLRPSNNTPCA